MAPIPTVSQHMTLLSKRNFETETWRWILGAIGAFILLGLIGILAGWWRHRSVKKQHELVAMAQRGSYAKIDEDRNSLDDLEGANGIRILRLQRTNSISSSSSSDSEVERKSDRGRPLSGNLYHPRSQSLYALPIATPRGRSISPYINSPDLHCGAHPGTESRTVPSATFQVLAPPRAAYVEPSMVIDNAHENPRGIGESRTSSPAPLVLARSISMLRPNRSLSLGR